MCRFRIERWAVLFLAVALMPANLRADRRKVSRPILPKPAPFSQVRLDVLVNGRALRKVSYRGQTYLPIQRKGEEFTLRLRNDGARRVEVCVTIDGLSIMDRKAASSRTRGYVVPARSEVEIRGWRRSDHEIAAFCFADRHRSLASQSGRPQQIGLISMTVHEEQRLIVPHPVPTRRDGFLKREQRSESQSDRAKSNGSAGARRGLASKSSRSRSFGRSVRGDVGTAAGRRLDDPVDYTTFRRSGRSRSVRYTYNLASKLAQAGILSYER